MFNKINKSTMKKGFSLIEVLIAVVVIGIGFMAAASMQGMSISSNSNSNYLTSATYLAQDKIEQLRRLAYTDITMVGSPESSIDDMGQSGGIFNRSWTVTPDSPGLMMKTVSVTVTWNERGRSHRLVMTTVING